MLILLATPPRDKGDAVVLGRHSSLILRFAADEVNWDYAPAGRDEAMGMPFDAVAKGYTEPGPHQIGRVYKKAIYRENESWYLEENIRAKETVLAATVSALLTVLPFPGVTIRNLRPNGCLCGSQTNALVVSRM